MESRNGKVWIVVLLVLLGCLLSVILGAVAGGAAGYFIARGGRILPRLEIRPSPLVPTPLPQQSTPQAPLPQVPSPRRTPVPGMPSIGTAGAYISQVTPDSPAATAGLQAGDIITAVDGTEVNADHDLVTLIKQHKPGDEVTLKVSRGLQEPLEAKVTLGEKPGEAGTPYLGVYYIMMTPRSQQPTN